MSFAKRRPDSRPSNTRYASSSGRGGTRFSSNTRVGGKGNNGGFSSQSSQMYFGQSALPTDATSTMESYDALKLEAEIDRKMGFDLYDMGPPKVGWLINMHSTSVQEGEDTEGAAAVNYYFLGEDGENFKAVLRFDPYFLIGCKGGRETDVEEYVRRKYEGLVKTTQRVVKEDLSMPNHIAGYKRTFVKIVFANVKNLLNVRRELLPLAEKNRKMLDAMDVYADTMTGGMELDNEFTELSTQTKPSKEVDVTDFITEVREYDVPYHVRTAIDEDIRIGKWYTVEAVHGEIKITEMPERLTRPDPIVLAFDIETTKLPLKFPDVQIDKIMMISYMIDGMGFLITNREIVSEDIEDFEYTPKPEYEGIFTIFNEKDEKALLERFFSHIQDAKPTVIVTYNGDFFDWPFVEGRAKVHGIDMYREIGFQKDSEDEYKSSYCCHMDAFRWVKRDSYLPQGSQGLKAVTTAKMGYDPKELDPELMTRYASEHPQILSEYSVSDAVATYYLYMKYVHPFIFSLCNIIPLNPDEVLRKGTGTLCEMLLMVQAYQGNIVLPNKHKEADERFYEGHLLESETYVGGHVESLEAGVFRSDIPTNFDVDPKTIDRLLNELDDALKFTIEVESKKKLEDVTNYDEIREQIASKLQELKETHKFKECPLIYHLDVSSMYPNIMITNRLQPDSMVTEADCATCDFNRPGKNCDRRLPWSWRGEFFPAKKDEYNMIRRTLQGETFPGKYPNQPPRTFADLPMSEQNALVKKRLSDYSRKVYHKIKETKTIEKEAIICQRENPFYADTVRDFRDRRYEYKNQQKLWKRNLEKVDKGDAFAREEAKKMVILYDSLQLAHKVILNSFYGYVMRKGSRWYSMEMAGVTCLTGATIIQMARALVEKIGRPLELDTDGIWCILPKSFPENFLFKLKDGGKVFMSYPCAMLNHLVHDKFTNNQYQTLVDPEKFKYEVKSENSIFFEVDGPYRAMILPTSKEEDKNLKKRYAVFNDDGSLAELKGFEVKRRGELRLIKIFQSQIFKVFLDGSSLEECYASVAKVSDRWLDVLDSKGVTLADDELIDLICENRSMSRALEDYGSQKSTSISTARRLAEFLGDQMVKDKGLNCKYIISEKPKSAPVTERAIPVAIFSAEESIKSHFLRRWLKDPSLTEFDPRDLIDWGYYRERLASVIQKIITIPAALQRVPNPVPRVGHPDWLHKRIQRLQSGKQTSLDVFKTKPLEDVTNKAPLQPICDLEDLTLVTATSAAAVSAATKARGSVAKVVSKRKQNQVNAKNEDDTEALFASLPLVQPDINTDYVGWLGYMKKKWKIQRQARERRKHLFGDSMVSHRANAGEVTSFLKNQAEKRYGKEWQILQIAESETPGVLKCWVMITGRIQSVTIKVDRKVYVDFKDDDFPDLKVTDMTVEKVNRTLPNGSSSPRLFRLTMKDEFYAAECQKVTSIFTHQSVAGVYEGHIDNATRFVLDFGNSCQINMEKKGVLGKGLESGFEVSSLIKCPANQEYLNSVSLRVVFLYHVVSGDRQIFAIFSSFDEQADIFVYESSSRQQQPFPNLETVYKTQFDEMASRLQTQSAAFKPPETLKFNVDQHSSLKRTKRAVSARLLKLYSDSSNQAVLALMSPHARAIERDFAVVREMPVLRFAPSQADLSLPPLGWQLPLARRIVLHFLGLGGRIAKMTEMARYANIPLGNLKPDDTRLVIDVQYARKLQEAGVILWWSPTPFPDLGGREKDQSLLITENLEMPVINNASSYEDVCIDISVQNLVINTVLTSALINEMEGTDNSSTGAAGDGASLSFMENASSAPAIAVLRNLVKQWWEEALAQDKHADEMVNNFVLWVSSAESHLFDPVLQYHVRNLSRKAFLQLLAEFRRVGSQVVHAQQDKLVIKTSKAVVGNAYSYAQYVVKSICAKPLFNFLELKVTQYWDYLLWMDDVNYGGFACTELVNESALQTYSLVMNWHIKSFLPEMLQNEFSVWVEDFLELMHTAKTNEFNPAVSSGTPRVTQLRGFGRSDDEFFAKGTVLSLQKQLKKRTTHLLRRQIDATASEDAVASAIYKFPTLPGSHLKLTNPTLELVKSLCAVLSLVRELNLEVRVVRRDLLALFEVKEFSDAGVFKNPSTSLKLSQICTSCSLESELDFCRDEKLIPLDLDSSSGTEQQQQRNISWKCKHCARDFNRLAIEERMISDVMSVVTSYQTQDLRCSKCKQIKEDNLSEYCMCSGEWELSMSPEEIRKRLNVYRNVAEFYGLRMLDSLMRTIVT